MKFSAGTYKISTLMAEDPISKPIVERLAALGFGEGKIIRIYRRAPFSGPYIIDFENTRIALREEELQCLKLQKV